MKYRRFLTALAAGIMALGLMATSGYAAERPMARELSSARSRTAIARPRADTPKHFDSRAAMIEAANVYAKSNPAHIISAAALFDVVQSKDVGYQIVDIRSAAHYALGHIDGAINIPFTTIADDASLAQLDASKKIVVVCYTGETSSMTTMVWGMLGYDTRALLFGMSGWVADKAIVGMDIPTGVAAGYPTTVEPTETRRTYRAPKLDVAYASFAEAVKGPTKAYFAKGLAPVMTASQVQGVMGSDDPDYQVISVRETADYATGHLAGAPNLVWSDLANQMNKLDPTKKVVVYCYTGNLGGEYAMLLNLMGYEAYNMMSGMSAWNSDPTVGGVTGFNPAAVLNYYTVK